MTSLPPNKQDALALIIEMSESLYAQTQFEHLKEIDELLEARHQLIEQFFCDFKKTITDQDLDAFRQLQKDDDMFRQNIEANKVLLNQKMAGEKKSKQRMRLYTKISRQF